MASRKLCRPCSARTDHALCRSFLCMWANAAAAAERADSHITDGHRNGFPPCLPNARYLRAAYSFCIYLIATRRPRLLAATRRSQRAPSRTRDRRPNGRAREASVGSHLNSPIQCVYLTIRLHLRARGFLGVSRTDQGPERPHGQVSSASGVVRMKKSCYWLDASMPSVSR